MSANQQTIEETKAQIRGLVNEIAALGQIGWSHCRRVLSRAAGQRSSRRWPHPGGAIWLLDDDQAPEPAVPDQCRTIAADQRKRRCSAAHSRLIQRVANTGQSLLVPPYSGTTDGDAEGNPTRFLLVLGSLSHDGHKRWFDRNLSAARHGARHAARLPAIPGTDVRLGGRMVAEPEAAHAGRPPGAVAAVGFVRPRRARVAWS